MSAVFGVQKINCVECSSRPSKEVYYEGVRFVGNEKP